VLTTSGKNVSATEDHTFSGVVAPGTDYNQFVPGTNRIKAERAC
jgi:hypothetical protein